MALTRPMGFEKLDKLEPENNTATTIGPECPALPGLQGFATPGILDAKGKIRKQTADTEVPAAHIQPEMDRDTYPGAGPDSGSNKGEAVNQNGKPKPGIRVIHPMIGGSVLDYAYQPIDDKKTLIGNRYLCRGGGMFIVAPSGQGKSTLGVQMAAEWALGYSPIGLSARNEPLRTLIVQAEDDAGDVTEMSRWIRTSEMFSDDQLKQIDLNTHIEPCNDVTGDEFLGKLDSFIEQFGPDIVIANPYSSYLGGDVKDEKLANQFLRNGLTPLLVKHQCAIVWMHHTPKTQYSPVGRLHDDGLHVSRHGVRDHDELGSRLPRFRARTG